MKLLMSLVLVCLSMALVGCSGSRNGPGQYDIYEADAATQVRDTSAAEAAHDRALTQLEAGDEAEAEATLREALARDVMFGRAHNTLGVIYFRQGRYYEAAWEFQYAAKLMPRQPEPLNNLGLVFERVGKLGDAVETYEQALSLRPDSVELLGNLARSRYRRGDDSEELARLLGELLDRDVRPDWVAWARDTLARFERAERLDP